MRRIALFAALASTALALTATPVLADGITLTIDNRSDRPVTRLNTFAVDSDGSPIEDNLGAILEDIPAQSTGTLDLSLTACARVYVALSLGDSDDELSTTLNTCKSRRLVVSD